MENEWIAKNQELERKVKWLTADLKICLKKLELMTDERNLLQAALMALQADGKKN